jgi:hypothetical protein
MSIAFGDGGYIVDPLRNVSMSVVKPHGWPLSDIRARDAAYRKV